MNEATAAVPVLFLKFCTESCMQQSYGWRITSVSVRIDTSVPISYPYSTRALSGKSMRKIINEFKKKYQVFEMPSSSSSSTINPPPQNHHRLQQRQQQQHARPERLEEWTARDLLSSSYKDLAKSPEEVRRHFLHCLLSSTKIISSLLKMILTEPGKPVCSVTVYKWACTIL